MLGIKYIFLKLKMKKLIRCATEIIYYNNFDLMNVLEHEMIGNKKLFDLICAYIAIEVAAELRRPLNKTDIKYAMRELTSPNIHLDKPDESQRSVDLFKKKAEISLLKLEIRFKQEEIAFHYDGDSYDGIKYKMEKAKRGPLSYSEEKDIENLAKQMAEAKKELQRSTKDKI